MKLNITFTYHYILFLGMAVMLAQPTFISPCAKVKEVKTEKTTKQTASNENKTEVLHSEMLFHY